jgi:tRNA dimethylallyltransferase
MMAGGFEEELRGLHGRDDLHPGLPALRAVGYRQGWQWLDGEFDAETLREKVLAATRQLAKRQLTWLRREEDALWYDPLEESTSRGVLSDVQAFLESA